MVRPIIDYSLYLVTGRELLPEGKDYYESLEQSLQGGVTVVQIREKTADTGEFYEVALKSKAICDKYSVPLFINDRLDVFFAVSHSSPSPPLAGIHIGQTDLPLPLARSLLDKAGYPDAVIGISCQTLAEAKEAKRVEADYVGVGPCWWTGSKNLKKGVLGVRGVEEVVLAFGGPAVAIGGIKSPNLPHLLHAAPSLSGVAIISEIVGAQDPTPICQKLQKIIKSYRTGSSSQPKEVRTKENIASGVADLLSVLRKEGPVVNQLTNVVVANDSANATLALGASPIMATVPSEVTQLSKIVGACLVNFGTIKDIEGMLAAGYAANQNGKPIIFDPVAVGASDLRRSSAHELLSTWQPTIIKGNAGEIGALLGSTEVTTRGVDSGAGGFKDPAAIVKTLARKERSVVVMTGEVDWISDGETVVKLSNGNHLLGVITGSGCMTGTLVACFAAAARLAFLASNTEAIPGRLVQGDMFLGAIAGVLAMTVASEVAAERPDVKGPNTFRSALIDEMYNLTGEEILKRANIEVFA
ncbi:putative thiamine biosynthetic bifunctional enzyme [Mrakia frigida]|uniref:bifunctional hydroxyethylthiazole kinase/thiamine-phosphate diphosphorylase n=1 Tax=Mrakia frigida TaxID=29902 RepID=UPI003FCBFC86